MKCNLYDNDFYFVGLGECQLDPMDSRKQGKEVYLLPANGTFKELPELNFDEVAKFENNEWVKIKDVSKNQYYDKENGREKSFNFGDIVDNTKYTSVVPIENYLYQKFENGSWTPDLESYKTYYRQLAKVKEAEKVNEGFSYNGNTFDCDEKAQIFISGLLSSVNAGTITGIGGFTTKNNIDIDLTANQIKELHLYGLIHIKSCHEWKRNKYLEIDNCNSLAQLEAVII
jgi:hypothetical protein